MYYTIVGLGNPGSEYTDTRHNVGRMALDVLRKTHGFSDWEERKEIKALRSDGVIGEDVFTLLEPDDYMNNSGKSVSKYLKHLSEEEKKETIFIILHDDIDLPIGTFRIVYNRGSGGHRGIDSIEKETKTKKYIRIRIGIAPLSFFGHMKKPKGTHAVQKHVLKNFSKKESQRLQEIFPDVVKAVEDIMTFGLERAMNTWN